jgi:hypothetical protein
VTEPRDAEDKPTLLPILIAAGVAAVVLIVFGIAALVGGDQLPDEAKVGRAVVAQNDALQRTDYAAFTRYTCVAEQRNEAEVLGRQRQSTTTQGARYVDDVTGVTVSGGRAIAKVVYHFERSPDNKISVPMTFAREGGDWKVCSAGPS